MPQFSSKSPTIRRILREAAELSNSPSPDYTAEPLESDLFEWHFTLRGPPNSVYGEGFYHGRIVLPPTYPLRPPSFRFTTPNGRFEANREICLSISGHHEETWQPAWGIRTAIVALRSFMETDARGQLGGLESPEAVRRRLAKESASFKCAACAKTNAEIIKESEERAGQANSSGNEIEVPKELNMNWRDEMKPKDVTPTADDQESAQLAEGFVQTVPTPQQTSDAPRAPAGNTAAPVRVPAPAPPAIARAPAQRHPSPPAAAQLQRVGNDGVPLWIDRAIVGLVVLLIAIVFKVLLGS
ncbi:Ubiquitin-conjugating enzyme [Paramyrothecium foliicola]|nr:Ubiquitin-conjugating enzyme [Paramyrothecium foliicola]